MFPGRILLFKTCTIHLGSARLPPNENIAPLPLILWKMKTVVSSRISLGSTKIQLMSEGLLMIYMRF